MAKIEVPSNKKTCDTMLAEIEAELVEALPAAVRKAKIKETAYGIMICYIDLTTDKYTPFVTVLPETYRSKCVADGDVSMIWSLPAIPGITCRLPEGKPLNKKCNLVYEFLSADWEDEDEEKVIRPFREMIYRVCLQLNELDWSPILPVTDDFTVMASDWTGYWVDADAKKSVPVAHRRMLKQKGLFFNPEALPEPKIPAGSGIAEMGKRSVEEQIPYWTDQLASLIQAQDCDASRAKWGAKRLIDALVKLGEPGGDALLTVVERFAEMSEWKGNKPGKSEKDLGPQSAMLCEALEGVEASARRDDATEKRLWGIFDRSLRVNRGCAVWGNLTASAAFRISYMFDDKYDFWVIRDFNNQIESLDEIAEQRKAKAPK